MQTKGLQPQAPILLAYNWFCLCHVIFSRNVLLKALCEYIVLYLPYKVAPS